MYRKEVEYCGEDAIDRDVIVMWSCKDNTRLNRGHRGKAIIVPTTKLRRKYHRSCITTFHHSCSQRTTRQSSALHLDTLFCHLYLSRGNPLTYSSHPPHPCADRFEIETSKRRDLVSPLVHSRYWGSLTKSPSEPSILSSG